MEKCVLGVMFMSSSFFSPFFWGGVGEVGVGGGGVCLSVSTAGHD